MTITNKTSYDEAKQRLRDASTAYYTAETTLMLDAEYDALLREIARVETEHPEWAEGDLASEQVASGAEVPGDFEHSAPMLSLDNIFSPEEFERWAAALEARIPEHPFSFLYVEPKMDGLSIAIRYENGKPVAIATRGDGQYGEALDLGLAEHLKGVPAEVTIDREGDMPWTGEVRGEVIFSRKQFEEANALRVANGDKPFVNARNGVAGAVRGHAGRSYALQATFIAFDVVDPQVLAGTPEPSHAMTMAVLEDIGFVTASSVMSKVPEFAPMGELDLGGPRTVEDIAKIIDLCTVEVTSGLDYETDGLVIKADRAIDREAAGFSSRAPRWATAYKFPETEVPSTLEEVIWQVGRTGVITPRARIAPVFVLGTTITYATLHNPDDMERKGFMIGDHVAVTRAGKVIPRLEYPLAALRDGTQSEIVVPEVCPECGSEIDRSQARWRCTRGRDCRAERVLVYAVSRDALDIDGLGPSQVRVMVESGMVTDVAGLFRVKKESLSVLPTSRTYADTEQNRRLERVGLNVPLGETQAGKIIEQIEQARSKPLAKIITALGIQGTGRSMSRRLAKHFGTMQALREATLEDLEAVEGIGGIKAGLIRAELDDLSEVLDALAEAGVNMGDQTAPESVRGPLEAPRVPHGDFTVLPDPSGFRVVMTSDLIDAKETSDAEVVPFSVPEGEVYDPLAAAAAPLEGLKVVVTGSMVGPLADLTRQGMEELIEDRGGKASSSVSKNTDLLVVGQKAGSKKDKAEALGVKIVTEDEFAQMVGLA